MHAGCQGFDARILSSITSADQQPSARYIFDRQVLFSGCQFITSTCTLGETWKGHQNLPPGPQACHQHITMLRCISGGLGAAVQVVLVLAKSPAS